MASVDYPKSIITSGIYCEYRSLNTREKEKIKEKRSKSIGFGVNFHISQALLYGIAATVLHRYQINGILIAHTHNSTTSIVQKIENPMQQQRLLLAYSDANKSVVSVVFYENERQNVRHNNVYVAGQPEQVCFKTASFSFWMLSSWSDSFEQLHLERPTYTLNCRSANAHFVMSL